MWRRLDVLAIRQRRKLPGFQIKKGDPVPTYRNAAPELGPTNNRRWRNLDLATCASEHIPLQSCSVREAYQGSLS